MKRIILFLSLVITSQLFSQQYSQLWSNINYANDGQVYHNMDIYLPQEVKSSYPVVVFIYGSAWLSNNSKGASMESVGAALLDGGFAVVTPNHRSSSDAIYPAQIHDIKAVVRYLRGNASTYNLDTSFVGITGFSSGGHLAALMGTTNGVGEYTVGSETVDIEGALGNFTSYSSEVDKVCDWFGPTDLLVMSSCVNGGGFDHDGPNSPGSNLIGGTIHNYPDKVALVNPITFVDPSDPPFIIFHGNQDNVVPYCQSELLDDALDNAGVPSDYTLVPGGQHGPGVLQQPYLGEMVDFFLESIDPIDPIPQGPYGGTAHAIPGTIQLEEYDLGGNGSAYNDDTPGSEVTPVVNYRTNEDVDIENCTDTGGGYNIGWATEGEWLEYTVDVTAAGTYDLEIRYAIGETGSRTIHVEMDGVNLTGAITLPNTGGWQTWQTFTVTDLALTAGEKVMRVSIDVDYVNLNYVTFKAVVQDTDNDGTPDNEDACPNDPNKAATAGACGCGTPDTDSDADGIADCIDSCPNDINKTTPGNCGCGNTEESCLDCAGTPNGTAFIDNCDNCVATQQEACEQDCNGDWGGTAAIDACNECTGGETGLPVITDPTKCLATGVEEESETMLRVYPNPTTGDLYLPTAKSWYLYNAQGEIIQEGDATYLNLSDHPDGMYFLKTEGNIIKVVKE